MRPEVERKGLAPKSRANALGTLHSLIEFAIDEGWAAKDNPVTVRLWISRGAAVGDASRSAQALGQTLGARSRAGGDRHRNTVREAAAARTDSGQCSRARFSHRSPVPGQTSNPR
jgi:hypothetical protein